MSTSGINPRHLQDPAFQRALHALRRQPASSAAYNNLGAWYLNETDDDASAEILFRRALKLDPGSGPARRNLLLVMRRRDLVHRVLNFPEEIFALLGRLKRRHGVAGSVLAFLASHTLLVFWMLWGVTILPPLKLYERLTRPAMERAAGLAPLEPGPGAATWPWPAGMRLALWLTLAGLYGGLLYLLFGLEPEVGILIAPPVLAVFFLVWLVGRVRARRHRARPPKPPRADRPGLGTPLRG